MNHKFQPVPVAEAVTVVTAAAQATKDCHYCGEQILVAARKCRHCGEILDVALRAAEEAKTMARHHHQPLVINNNASSSSAASAAASAGTFGATLIRSFVRFIVITLCLIFFGIISAVGGASEAGVVIMSLGLMMLIVGVPIYLLRDVWRVFFG